MSGNAICRSCFRVFALSCHTWTTIVRWRPSASAAIVTQLVTRLRAGRAGHWSPQPSSVRGSSALRCLRAVDSRRGVARLALVRRILLGAVAVVLLLAVGTRAADALGVGGVRLRCGCVETCWCKRPGLTVFRWVTPGRWHHIGLTAEEKQSRHSQA